MKSCREYPVNSPGLTIDEVIKVVSMRYDGASWEKCGQAIFKQGNETRKCLIGILSGERKAKKRRNLPTLRQWMIEENVPLSKIADGVGCSLGEMKNFMIGRSSRRIMKLVSNYTGIDYETIRREYYDVKMGSN